jgi:hypothetical protein
MLDWVLPVRTARRPLTSALVAALLVAASVAIGGPVLRLLESARVGSYTGTYFEAAVNWVYCGRYAQTTSGDPRNAARINLSEIRDPSAYDKTPRQLLEQAVGSVDAYCAEVSSTTAMEPAMFLLDAFVMRIAPSATLRELAGALATIRLVLLWILAWYLVRSGFSLPFAACVTGIAVYFTVLLGGNALYSAYPFILPLELAGVAWAGWWIWQRSWRFVAAAVVLGLWSGLLGNLRTSHFPVALALAAVFFAYDVRQKPWFISVCAGVAFAAALFAFEWAVTKPFTQGQSSHTIAHALVVGLANPPNALSKREGIEWLDDKGLEIARRTAPDVTFLSPEYERVLFAYYRGLWREHPGEMAGVYWRKSFAATEAVFNFLSQRGERPGTQPFWTSKSGRFLVIAALPIRFVSRVVTLAPIFVLMFAAGLALRSSWGDQRAWMVVATAVVGFFGFVEAAVILGNIVTLWYDGTLIFATTFGGLIVWEMLLSFGTNRGVGRPLKRTSLRPFIGFSGNAT